jgi:hypothetical protein
VCRTLIATGDQGRTRERYLKTSVVCALHKRVGLRTLARRTGCGTSPLVVSATCAASFAWSRDPAWRGCRPLPLARSSRTAEFCFRSLSPRWFRGRSAYGDPRRPRDGRRAGDFGAPAMLLSGARDVPPVTPIASPVVQPAPGDSRNATATAPNGSGRTTPTATDRYRGSDFTRTAGSWWQSAHCLLKPCANRPCPPSAADRRQ